MARGLVLLGALVASLAIEPPAAVAGGDQGSDGIAGHRIAQRSAEVRAFWTPERMRSAVPLDWPADRSAAAARGAGPIYLSQPPDQETSPSRDIAYPERIHGKLYVTFGSQNGSCSATVVKSFSRDLILTAGHCVVFPGGEGGPAPIWASNVMFVPGYRNGNRPFGTYVGTRARAPGIFAFEGDITFDVGAINLAPAAAGPIQTQLGARGVTFNRTRKSYRGARFAIFGYPALPASFYDAERLILCDSPFLGFQRDSGAVTAGPCHQQEGSSGGGWVLRGGFVNSVVSHAGCDAPSPQCDLTAGTYFGDLAFRLWAGAGGGLPKGRKRRLRRCRRIEGGAKRRRCITRAETFKPVVR